MLSFNNQFGFRKGRFSIDSVFLVDDSIRDEPLNWIMLPVLKGQVTSTAVTVLGIGLLVKILYITKIYKSRRLS